MKYLVAISVGLILTIGPQAGKAQIYQSTDEQGNPVFSDEPTARDSAVVDLTETNISDAPAPQPAENGVSASQAKNKPTANSGNRPEYQDPNEEAWEEHVQRTVETEGIQSTTTRHEVLDAEPRHEVMDAQPRREVMDAEPRHVVEDAEPRRKVGDLD